MWQSVFGSPERIRPVAIVAGRRQRRRFTSRLALAAAAAVVAVVALGTAAGPVPPAAAATAPPGYSPAQLQSAYEIPPASPASPTVAVVAPYDDPDVASDLAAYRLQFGLPACTAASGCFSEIDESGGPVTPGGPGTPTANATWALQTSAELDAVSAICPGCKLLLVEVNSAAVTDLGTGVNFAADLGASAITIGASQPETNEEPAWDTEYFQHPGIAITVGAGSGGYQADGVNYPGASPWVTAVGGTTLLPAGTGTCTTAAAGLRGWCETTWNDASGATVSGCSLYEPEPSWQAAGLPGTDTGCGSLRTVADVAADADPATGIAVYDSYGEGGWQPGTGAGGTNVAAAIVAAVYALAGTPQAGTPAASTYPAQYPYLNGGPVNDITSGSNTSGTCSPSYLCTAGPGYDGPTGLGSPDGTDAFAFPASVHPAEVWDPANSELQVYATGPTGTLEEDYWHSGTWSGWQNLGGSITGTPAPIYDPSNSNLEIYATGSTGSLEEDHWKNSTGAWSGWSSLGGSITGSPTVAWDADDTQMHVFATGADGTLDEDWWAPGGAWSGVVSKGGSLSGSPVVIYDASVQNLEVYATGSAGTLEEDYWSSNKNAWSGWGSLGGSITGSPAVAWDAANSQMHVFATGADGTLEEDWWAKGDGWSGIVDLGGSLAGSPAVIYDPIAKNLEVYATGSAGTLQEDYWSSNKNAWSGWGSPGGSADTISTSPSVVYNSAVPDIEVYGFAPNGSMAQTTWSNANNWQTASRGGSFSL